MRRKNRRRKTKQVTFRRNGGAGDVPATTGTAAEDRSIRYDVVRGGDTFDASRHGGFGLPRNDDGAWCPDAGSQSVRTA
jgi:hypothetical protein